MPGPDRVIPDILTARPQPPARPWRRPPGLVFRRMGNPPCPEPAWWHDCMPQMLTDDHYNLRPGDARPRGA